MSLNTETRAVYAALDLGNRLPLGRVGMRQVNGILYFVISREAAKREGLFMRLRCFCPYCFNEYSAARLHQHLKVHNKGDAA